MILLMGGLLIIQIYLLGFTFYLPESFLDTSFQFLYIFQTLLIGSTLGFLIKSYKESKLIDYLIISIPLLFLATFRWIFLNEFIMRFLDKIISSRVVNIIFVDKVNEISWIALGGLLYLIVLSLIKGNMIKSKLK